MVLSSLLAPTLRRRSCRHAPGSSAGCARQTYGTHAPGCSRTASSVPTYQAVASLLIAVYLQTWSPVL